ncbi:MAG TPA: 50S ribosomal protein L21 [Alphaproteobacteria bacterium]|nr:50S ribosomal protein L21 [Alphaproteobacteria bacterium]
MYAVVKTGGKQYRVTAGDVIRVEKLAVEAGSFIELKDVLMLAAEGATTQIGTPRIEGAVVTASVLEQLRDDTVIVFKKKRRHNYRRKNGHRQHLTVLRIAEIVAPGAERKVAASDVKPARPKKVAPPAPPPVVAPDAEPAPEQTSAKKQPVKAKAKSESPAKAEAAPKPRAKAASKAGAAKADAGKPAAKKAAKGKKKSEE